MVFEKTSATSNLLSVESIHATCAMQAEVRALSGADEACWPSRSIWTEDPPDSGNWQLVSDEGCCATRSLGTYIARLQGRAKCADITQEDVDAVVAKLKTCAKRYYDKDPTDDTAEDGVSPLNSWKGRRDSAEVWEYRRNYTREALINFSPMTYAQTNHTQMYINKLEREAGGTGCTGCPAAWMQWKAAEVGSGEFSCEDCTVTYETTAEPPEEGWQRQEWDGPGPWVVDDCELANWAYEMLHVLLDNRYQNPDYADDPRFDDPGFVKVLVPVGRWRPGGEAFLSKAHFEHLTPRLHDDFGGATLTAYDIGDKFALFTTLMLTVDVPLIGVGTSVILVMIWLYSGSLFVTLLGMLQIFLAMVGAYFLYMVVLWMPFFPFLNITGIFICIGIGADDIFVFLEALDLAFRTHGKDAPDEKVLTMALYDAGAATLVTSLTTAAAFCATVVSPISSIKCFGIFCALVVMCDWVLMIVYLPGLCLFFRRHVHKCCGACEWCPNQAVAATDKHLAKPSLASYFVKILSPIVSHRILRWVWLAITIGVAVALSTQAPRLSYPTSGDIQLFPDESPLERYCCVGPMAKEEFHLGSSGGSADERQLWMSVNFGVEPVDNGNGLDPMSFTRPPLVPIAPQSRAGQQFIKGLCEDARRASWYDDDMLEPALPNCTLEVLMRWMEMPCAYGQSYSGECCDISLNDFPYEPSLFEACVKERSNMTKGQLPAGRVLYDRATGEIVHWRMSLPTRHAYSEAFHIADAYWQEIEGWWLPKLAAAPSEMAGGYASLDMGMFFYALLRATSQSAIESTIVAGIVAGIVILALTANVLVALYCALSIALIIGGVTGTVVLQGWKLGIIESVIFSTAIGMACDFVAHLGFAYRQANRKGEADTCAGLVKVAIGRIAPAVTAAGVSTALMGYIMTFASTTFFRKFGFFIVLLMSVSWLYAFLCLLPLLTIAGPRGTFLDLSAFFGSKRRAVSTAPEVTQGESRQFC